MPTAAEYLVSVIVSNDGVEQSSLCHSIGNGYLHLEFHGNGVFSCSALMLPAMADKSASGSSALQSSRLDVLFFSFTS